MRKKTKKKTKERLIGIGTIIFGFFVLWINCKFDGQILIQGIPLSSAVIKF